MTDARHLILAAASALLLAGCGSASPLTTASLTGDANATAGTAQATAAPAGPPPSDPTSRAVQVGATSARAMRCGYNFDPAKLKANFIAAEAAQGTGVDQLQKVEREYDYTVGTVGKAALGDPDYCSNARTKIIKADLGRHLAGDFTPVMKKEDPQSSLFSDLFGQSDAKPFQPDKFFDEQYKRENRM